MNKKLCIIIPMYNAEAFIERTIYSITESNLPEDYYEILIVNDGSTDNGEKIVQTLAKKFLNLQLLTQKNGGSSVARNTGIDNTEAEYIWFIDSDDKAEKDLSIILELIRKYPDVDVFDFEYNWVNDKNEIFGHGSSHPSVVHNEVIHGRDAILQGYTAGSVCGLILKREFLNKNNLRFKVGITQQDVELSFHIFACAAKVLFRYEVIYNYLIRQNSISKATDAKRKTKYECDKVEIIKSFRRLASEFETKDKELSSHIRRYADGALFGCTFNMLKNRRQWKHLGINKAVIAKLKGEGLYPLKGPFGSWKKWAMSKVLNIEWFLS